MIEFVFIAGVRLHLEVPPVPADGQRGGGGGGLHGRLRYPGQPAQGGPGEL